MLRSLNLHEIVIRMAEDTELPARKVADYLGVALTDVDPIVAAIKKERDAAMGKVIPHATDLDD